MGLIAHELNVDFNTPTFVPKPITDFLREISLIDNASERFSKLREYITSLEDEMRKIDAFRRELPLCMLLLRNAILYLKDESVLGTRVNTKQVLEEFIPLKKDYDQDDGGVNEDKDSKDKKSWMSSVQLWNSDNFSTTDLTYTCDHKPNSKVETKLSIQAKNGCTIEDPFETCKNNGGSKMFRPFRGRSSFPVPQLVRKEDKDELSIQGFSILGHGMKGGLMEDSGSSGSKTSCCRAASSSAQNIQSDLWLGLHPSQQQTNRKQRRCWSHELHRRFVNALQQLGGSQAATPKQIREFMQVDGLTNDEVKSHLQKYRLHTRRMPAPSATSVKQSAVDFVGQWVPQDQYGESSKHSSSQSGSPQGPLQLCRVTGEDEEDEKSENYS